MIRFRSSKSIGSVSVLIAQGVYNLPFEHGVYQKEALMKLGRLVRLTVALLALPLLAYAQDATLSGTVKDNTGGVLPGVTVTATNQASGITFTSVSDERGLYRMPVRAGVYKINAELTGFTTATRPDIELLLGRAVTLDFTM